MKTRNNVQKTILKSLTVVVSLVLISVTINAQDFWKTVLSKNSFNQIALAMVELPAETHQVAESTGSTNATIIATYAAEEKEDALELENWMTSENLFFGFASLMKPEREASLELENWMTKNFYAESFKNMIAESETQLDLEEWMTNDNYFYVPELQIETETENTLELEDWMVNEKIFNHSNSQKNKNASTFAGNFEVETENTLTLENWMISEKTW